MRRGRRLHRLRRDESGTTVVELAFVIPLFLLLIFGLLDFGRLAYNWVSAEKAMQMAARMAAVRPAACSGVPNKNEAASGNTARFGRPCKPKDGGPDPVCEGEKQQWDVDPHQCSGSSTNPTADAIWNAVGPLLPGNATLANLCFEYRFLADMNFLGGPYVPLMTVEIFQQDKREQNNDYCPGGQPLNFAFVSPLLGLARLAGATNTGPGNTYTPLTFPPMSVSLPGEDLALGEAG